MYGASALRGAFLQGRTLFRQMVGNVGRITGAVGLAQLVALAAAPVITRVYTPDAFGLFALFCAVIALLSPLASLRYCLALPLPTDREKALDLLALCLLTVAASSLTVGLAAVLAGPAVIHWTGGGIDARLLDILLFPVGLSIHGLFEVGTYWLIREQSYSAVALVRFSASVGAVILQIVLSQIFFGATGLMLGYIGGYLLGLLVAAWHGRFALRASLGRFDLGRLVRIAVEYKAFALITAPSGVLNAFGSQMPNMALPSLFGLGVTGQYSLAMRVLGQPMVFVGQGVNQVLSGTAARYYNEQPASLWPLFLWLNAALLALMAPTLLLTWYGEAIFRFVFGPEWAEAGRYAGVIVIASFLGLAAQGTTALHVYRLNHWMCGWEVTQFVLVGGALAATRWQGWTPMGCMVAIALALATSNLVLLGLNAIAARRARTSWRGGSSNDTGPLKPAQG